MKNRNAKIVSVCVCLLICLLTVCSCEILPTDEAASDATTVFSFGTPPEDAQYDMEIADEYLIVKIRNETKPESQESVNEHNTSDMGGCVVDTTITPTLDYTSVSEMQDKILNYKLSQEELDIIATFQRDENGNVPLRDVSKVCEPSLPDGVTYTGVRLYNTDMTLWLTTSDGKDGVYTTMSTEEYLEDVGHEWALEREGARVYKIDDRNATVIEYEGLLGLVRFYLYEITTESATITVGEAYHFHKGASDTVDVYAYVQSEKQNYCVTFYCLDERPSVEWFSSFGLAHTE